MHGGARSVGVPNYSDKTRLREWIRATEFFKFNAVHG